jgi:hypothetical protein
MVTGGGGGHAGVRPFEPPLVRAPAVPVYAHVAGDGEGEQVGGEAAHVVAHASQDTQRGRRLLCRRLVPRDDHARWRIPADAPPRGDGEHEQRDESSEGRQHAAVVAQEPAHALCTRRRGYEPLRKGQHDGQSFVRLERRG